MAMDNCRSSLKKLLCCSHDGTRVGAHQGLLNPQSGPPQSSPTAPAVLPSANPEGAVGLEQPLEELKKKLDLQSKEVSSRVVVIYGCGGIGKTTLANALVTSLAEDLKSYNCIKVEINEDPLQNDFTNMKEWILNSCETKEPVFMFVDNVQRSDDLKELLPKDLRGLPKELLPKDMRGLPKDLPHGSRILVTSRKLSVTDLFEGYNIPRHSHAVNPVAEEHALNILCEDPTHLDQIRKDADRITRIAGAIPVVLKIVGAHLRKHKYKVENCSQILKALEHEGDFKKENLENLVDFVYNDLEPSTQEAFLDICSFFNGWPRRWVEYIVGVHEVTLLAEAALITSLPFVNSVPDPVDWKEFRRWKKHLSVPKEFQKEGIYLAGEDQLIVENVIQAKGRSMGKSTRITNWESWESWCRAATSEVQTIKGVKLDRNQGIVAIEDKELTRISHSVRTLILGSGISINARSNEPFKELRCLILNGQICCLPMNLEWHPSLSFYVGSFIKEVLIKFPPKLKYIQAKQGSYTDVDKCAKSIVAVQNSSLEELDLTRLENMRVILDHGRLLFDTLKILSLEGWEQMEELPHQVCDLTSLNKLILRECHKLKRISESIDYLRALTHLDLSDCMYLKEVCSSLGTDTALRYFDLTSCKALRILPGSFGNLSALECLSLRGCSDLQELPQNFPQLRLLKNLDFSGCYRLKELPSNFGDLSALECLTLSGCSRLQELPGNFAQLRSSRRLVLTGCEGLKELPSNFGQLGSLRGLVLSGCEGLKELPSNFAELSALECLSLSGCSGLQELRGNFPQLRSLKSLDFTGCNRLKELPSNFGELSALECISLSGCSRLQELPENFAQLRSLKSLDLSYCKDLTKLPSNFAQLSVLEYLSLSRCSGLEELPKKLDGLISLKILNLTDCDGLKELPSDFGQLSALEFLSLALSGSSSGISRRSTDFPRNIARVRSLKSLDLSGYGFLDSLPSNFGELSALEYLCLRRCTFLKDLSQNFAQLRSLKSLDLTGCGFLKELPSKFGELSALEYLSFSGCTFLGELPDNFAQLRSLKSLDLTDCGFLKKLPSNFGELSALEYLCLRKCSQLEELPGNFAKLKSLKSLVLNGCRRLKEFPSNFAQLESLKRLDFTECDGLKKLPPDFFEPLQGLEVVGP